jgi:ABC-type amino acid transport substrate-binding protein
VLDDVIPAAYIAKQQPQLWKTTPVRFDATTSGIVLKHGSDLTPAVAAALDYLIKKGAYAHLFSQYNVPKDGKVAKAAVNTASVSAALQ